MTRTATCASITLLLAGGLTAQVSEPSQRPGGRGRGQV